jgi:hypothetical protein
MAVAAGVNDGLGSGVGLAAVAKTGNRQTDISITTDIQAFTIRPFMARNNGLLCRLRYNRCEVNSKLSDDRKSGNHGMARKIGKNG